MIFAVLCLTVFAVLTLSTSNAEKALADRTASFVAEYYQADTKATKIKARIFDAYQNGLFPGRGLADSRVADDLTLVAYSNGALDIAVRFEGERVYVNYSCEINEVQDLFVSLKLEGGDVDVLEWRTVYSREWEIDDGIFVWDGEIL